MQARSDSLDLARLGFSSFVEAFEPLARAGFEPARVVVERRGAYLVACARGERPATVAGKLRHETLRRADLPSVGDWVAIARTPDDRAASIHAVVPRRTAFVRTAAGKPTEAQIVAANVDVVFVVDAVTTETRLRRVERYLAVARASGADVVVVLTKADAAHDVASRRAQIEAIASGAPVHAVSAFTGEGIERLLEHLAGDRTAALVGPSGVGKSTLANRLLGVDAQRVGAVAADGRGTHTTTERQLQPLPTGGVLVDTPGMRELGLWDDGGAEQGLHETFADVSELARACRFRDCSHHGEPGCAIRAALEGGALDAARWESFDKLARELASVEERRDTRALLERKRAARILARAQRSRPDKRK